MLVSSWLVILSFLLHVTNVGTSIPLNMHVGPKGNMRSTPLLCSSLICSISSSKTFIPSLIMPSLDKGLKPVTSVTFNLDAAIMITHTTARPSSAANPRTVKWFYLKEFLTCARMSLTTINFCLPALPYATCYS
jgi:hypothetical protein